ncbi:hypothetical protein HY489_01490 [Candidatus Woesearchaeota archaeon]|nr:hypothetical protein [Candidatus Woesearchaeota archaeon]
MKNTQEAGKIKILKANKIKDGIVRITFAAGKAAQKIAEEEKTVLDKTAQLLGCNVHEIPGRALELFEHWKKARKATQKKEAVPELKLTSKEKYTGDILAKTAENLQTQPDQVVKTIERFTKDISQWREN